MSMVLGAHFSPRTLPIDFSTSKPFSSNRPAEKSVIPEITWFSEERVKGEEGCLSVPGIYDGVERAVAVKVKAADAQGQVRELEAEGLMAVCVQHELDHLMGKVFVEYLSPLKRNRIKTKLLKALRDDD